MNIKKEVPEFLRVSQQYFINAVLEPSELDQYL